MEDIRNPRNTYFALLKRFNQERGAEFNMVVRGLKKHDSMNIAQNPSTLMKIPSAEMSSMSDNKEIELTRHYRDSSQMLVNGSRKNSTVLKPNFDRAVSLDRKDMICDIRIDQTAKTEVKASSDQGEANK